MFLPRITIHAAALGAVVLALTSSAGGAAAGGTSTAPPATPAASVKIPEVSTVGTTPAVLTVAERLKLAQLLAANGSRPKETIPPALLQPQSIPPFETRSPATGPRDRTKPIMSAQEIAEREKGGGR